MNLKNIIALAVMICLSSTPVLAKKEKDKNKALPQGLQMKLDRGGSLPPGWQKKLVNYSYRFRGYAHGSSRRKADQVN
jgi:hypothetical protein